MTPHMLGELWAVRNERGWGGQGWGVEQRAPVGCSSGYGERCWHKRGSLRSSAGRGVHLNGTWTCLTSEA